MTARKAPWTDAEWLRWLARDGVSHRTYVSEEDKARLKVIAGHMEAAMIMIERHEPRKVTK